MSNVEKNGIRGKGDILARQLYGGGRRPRWREQFGGGGENASPALHGETAPPLRSRINSIRNTSVVELTEADLAYLGTYEIVEAYRGYHADMCQAIFDAIAHRRKPRFARGMAQRLRT